MQSILIFSSLAFAESICSPDVCCRPAGDCCMTDDPLMMAALFGIPLVVLLVFALPIRISWMQKAVRNQKAPQDSGRKALVLGVLLSLLSLLALEFGINKCAFPNGIYRTSPPTAVIEADKNKVSPPFEEIGLSASKSFDDSDYPLQSYAWRLIEQPRGSSIELPTLTEKRVDDFKPDLFGEYLVELIVTNAYGIQSKPAEYTINAVPKQKLWIEMFWEETGEDMDLHLIRGDQTWDDISTDKKIRKENDCFFRNCISSKGSIQDWGVEGAFEDNPTLDLDDTQRNGPENINIMTPVDEDYLVGVHYYNSSGASASNIVYLRVYFDRELVWEGQKQMVGEKSFMPFVKVNTGSGAITEL